VKRLISSCNTSAPECPDSGEWADVARALEALEHQPPSQLADHGCDCCRGARGWFQATARAMACLDSATPRWIRERWQWGPQEWPLWWCQAVERDQIDCGAFAALTREAFAATGQRTVSVQLIERFDARTVDNWMARWSGEAHTSWLFGKFCYHEAVGLVTVLQINSHRQSLRIWDPVDTCWVEHRHVAGYGSVVACRVLPASPACRDEAAEYDWRGHMLQVGCWHVLG